MVPRRRRRITAVASFALLALVAELAGRSVTGRIDRAFHVEPLARADTSYYPFLLAGVKILAALALAALAWRVARAWAAASAAERLLAAVGHRPPRAPRVRLRLSPRLWLTSFTATSLWYLVQTDAERFLEGRGLLLYPWLHTYALPVFAVLAVLVAVAWSAIARWLADVEDYAVRTAAHARRLLGAIERAAQHVRPRDELAPRRLFGLAFESRPPPLPA